MIKNTAFLAALTLFLLVAWLAGELSFLAPYKVALFRLHGTIIVGAILAVEEGIEIERVELRAIDELLCVRVRLRIAWQLGQ